MDIAKYIDLIDVASDGKVGPNDKVIKSEAKEYLKNIKSKLDNNGRPKSENEYLYSQDVSKVIELIKRQDVEHLVLKQEFERITKEVIGDINAQVSGLKDSINIIDPTTYFGGIIAIALNYGMELIPDSAEAADFGLEGKKIKQNNSISGTVTLGVLAGTILYLAKRGKMQEVGIKLKEFAKLSGMKIRKIPVSGEVSNIATNIENKVVQKTQGLPKEIKEFYKSNFSNKVPTNLKKENPVAWINEQGKIFYNKAQFETKLGVQLESKNGVTLFDGVELKAHKKATEIISHLKVLKSHEVTHRVLEANGLKEGVKIILNGKVILFSQEKVAGIIDGSIKVSQKELLSIEKALQEKIPGLKLLDKAGNIDPKNIRKIDTKTISKQDKNLARETSAAKSGTEYNPTFINSTEMVSRVVEFETSAGLNELKNSLAGTKIKFPELNFSKDFSGSVAKILGLARSAVISGDEKSILAMKNLLNSPEASRLIEHNYSGTGSKIYSETMRMIEGRISQIKTLKDTSEMSKIFGTVEEIPLIDIVKRIKSDNEFKNFNQILVQLNNGVMPNVETMRVIGINLSHEYGDGVKRGLFEAANQFDIKSPLTKALKDRVKQINTMLN